MQMLWGQPRSVAQAWTLRWCLWLLSVDVVGFEHLFLLAELVRVRM